MADRKGEEFVVALAVKDGAEVWATAIGKVGPNMGPQYPGARSTPTVDGDRMYVLGSDGDLACVERDKGKVVWTKNLKKDFGGTPGQWAYAESVLIDGDNLICTPGGKTATLVALKKKDGEVFWKCAVPGGDSAAYASPIAVEVGGIRQYVQFLAQWRGRRRGQDGQLPVALRQDQGPGRQHPDAGVPRRLHLYLDAREWHRPEPNQGDEGQGHYRAGLLQHDEDQQHRRRGPRRRLRLRHRRPRRAAVHGLQDRCGEMA